MHIKCEEGRTHSKRKRDQKKRNYDLRLLLYQFNMIKFFYFKYLEQLPKNNGKEKINYNPIEKKFKYKFH